MSKSSAKFTAISEHLLQHYYESTVAAAASTKELDTWTAKYFSKLRKLIQTADKRVSVPEGITERNVSVSAAGIPAPIAKEIRTLRTKITYRGQLVTSGKPYTIHFFFSGAEVGSKAGEDTRRWAHRMVLWLEMAAIITSESDPCRAKPIDVYVYMTTATKRLPATGATVLSEIHANTAYTFACDGDAGSSRKQEIIIYRKEEFFKVFIHETFHALGLDFSALDPRGENIRACNATIEQEFPAIRGKSKINAFEAYAEFWAEIMNVAICCYELVPAKLYNKYISLYIKLECAHSMTQMEKVLSHMGLRYSDLFIRATTPAPAYQEKTNIFAYYVLKCILLCHYPQFIRWCVDANCGSPFGVKFVANNAPGFAEIVCSFARAVPSVPTSARSGNTLRMTICELE